MAKNRIFTVGFELPGEAFEHVPFDSDQSVLDADVVLYKVGFGLHYPMSEYQGEPLFDQSSSVKVAKSIAHWRAELVAAVNAGKLVVVYLASPLSYFRHTGVQEFSGTGRSRVPIDIVERVNSYDAIPRIESAVAKSGSEVRLAPEADYLAAYWLQLGSVSPYEAFIEGEFSHKVLVTKSGDKLVAAAVRGQGSLLFLPPLAIDEEAFTEWDDEETEVWTDEALQFGRRAASELIGLKKALGGEAGTPPPSWVSDAVYGTPEEGVISSKIADAVRKVERLQTERATLELSLAKAGELRALLFEKGKPLEHAVRDALETMGFTAKPFKDGDSEFDVVFECDEGRCLGEVEGRDKKLINIDKFSQLERNVQEDFARDEVHEYAKPVLFGNAHRLLLPDERGDAFTAKCHTAAQRTGAALVRTCDLFVPTRYLRSVCDGDYAASCRAAILSAEGAVVVFPEPPVDLSPAVEERPAEAVEKPHLNDPGPA